DGAEEEAPAAIQVIHGRKPDGESREFPVAFSGKPMWRYPGILLDRKQLEESERLIELTDRDFARMNPNTKTAPIFRSRRDAEITRRVYERVPVLMREGPPEENPWGLTIRRVLDMNKSEVLEQCKTEKDLAVASKLLVPVFESKMINSYDHRYATYAGEGVREVGIDEKYNASYDTSAYYNISRKLIGDYAAKFQKHAWLLVWRNIARSTDSRSLIGAILPLVGTNFSIRVGFIKNSPVFGSLLLATFNTFIIDYVSRQKLGSANMSDYITKQLPILPPSAFSVPCRWEVSAGTVADWIKLRVLELVYTSHSLEPFALDLGYTGRPFTWDVERRFALRCELDAAFFHLYGIDTDDADYILETFPIVKRHDEAEFGEYRTKRVILERYDAFAVAMRSRLQNERP
ncbi:MAG TPA: hypothetical protein VMV83_16250, partial [Rectinemataceae bacterium]|nr:hypothetical protein [Rectinemataceae bacterium]